MSSTSAIADNALQTTAYLSDTRVWSAELKTASRRWLRNFESSEHEYAACLLDSFVYYSGHLTDRLFSSAFDGLANEVSSHAGTYLEKKAAWRDFRDSVLVTHPTGEMPNATDSGYAFDRRARQLIGLPEQHIGIPELVLQAVARGQRAPIVFVDDFVGSGDQFVKTWHREYSIDGNNISFASIAPSLTQPIFYCPLICTLDGLTVIEASCSPLRLRPVHVLPPEYSARHELSLIWPPHLRAGASDFVTTASARAGISAQKAWGYQSLGLTVAFEHGVPDATLPILWWEEGGWTPLIRRR